MRLRSQVNNKAEWPLQVSSQPLTLLRGWTLSALVAGAHLLTAKTTYFWRSERPYPFGVGSTQDEGEGCFGRKSFSSLFSPGALHLHLVDLIPCLSYKKKNVINCRQLELVKLFWLAAILVSVSQSELPANMTPYSQNNPIILMWIVLKSAGIWFSSNEMIQSFD